MYNRNYEVDMDSVAALLQNAVEKVKTQENPDVMNDLKKVFKKNVPFTMRSYVAAYLAKELNRNFKGGFRPNKRNDRDIKDNRRNNEKHDSIRENKAVNADGAQEERQPRPRVQIDPSVAATIFISIGRNRRVFPRDLVGLLISVAGLDRDRIGDIRVLANYSFVQLFAEDADKAIAALNDYDYRGRKLVVSYSRQKDDTETASQNEGASQDDMQSAEDAAAYAAAEKAAANNEPFAAPHLSSDDAAKPEGEYLV